MNKRLFAIILSLFWLAAFTLPTAAEEISPLTPDGNLTITDDILIENKQFITVHSRSGTEFYIIIDRSRDADNVYFLNQVDDKDLFALLEDDSASVCLCRERCADGSVNNECLVCRMDVGGCLGKLTTLKSEQIKNSKQTGNETKPSIMPVLIIAAIIAGGAVVYFKKFRKKKPESNPEPDFDDYEDECYCEDDMETEIENGDE